MLWKFIVERKAREMIGAINRGDYEHLIKNCMPRFPYGYTFSGTHPLGGTFHTTDAMRQFYPRLFRLFPGIKIEIKEILVKGWPWNTLVMVWWVDNAHPAVDQPYINEGVQIVHIRWGRVAGAHFYLDTQKVEQVCRQLAQQGVAEAEAPPIVD